MRLVFFILPSENYIA